MSLNRVFTSIKEKASMIQRYDLITNYRCGSTIEEMESSDDGEWVRWEDVESTIGLSRRIQELELKVDKLLSTLLSTQTK